MCKQNNPFGVEEDVIDAPSVKGRGSIINTSLADLVAGGEYKVPQVAETNYVVVKGFENCTPSALHWTELRTKP